MAYFNETPTTQEVHKATHTMTRVPLQEFNEVRRLYTHTYSYKVKDFIWSAQDPMQTIFMAHYGSRHHVWGVVIQTKLGWAYYLA